MRIKPLAFNFEASVLKPHLKWQNSTNNQVFSAVIVVLALAKPRFEVVVNNYYFLTNFPRPKLRVYHGVNWAWCDFGDNT